MSEIEFIRGRRKYRHEVIRTVHTSSFPVNQRDVSLIPRCCDDCQKDIPFLQVKTRETERERKTMCLNFSFQRYLLLFLALLEVIRSVNRRTSKVNRTSRLAIVFRVYLRRSNTEIQSRICTAVQLGGLCVNRSFANVRSRRRSRATLLQMPLQRIK